MDNPNITMEDYIRLEEEKAQKYGKVFNWETAKYGKICFDDDIHDLRSVEIEFPAIVFNDEEEEQNILYFNDLFPFNIIHFHDLKSEKDNDDNDSDIILSSEDITDFEERLERIYNREIHKVQVVDFQWMPELMRDGLFAKMVMEHRDDVGGARRRLSWRQFILALGLHTEEEMESLGFARVECWIVCGSIGSAFTAEIVRGLTVIAPELPMIDMAELVRLHISQDALVIDDGGQADPAPVQAPPPPPMLA
ncbi:hypothetical protein Tco_1092716 [Tanacetum coccineum]|uniref:Uncharacterized protein n=1 Tax=Tanacetum coccineum TaxID=301880 RepID=A0ABQ5IAS4_9ASTR